MTPSFKCIGKENYYFVDKGKSNLLTRRVAIDKMLRYFTFCLKAFYLNKTRVT